MQASVRPVPEQISKIREDYPHSIALSYGNRRLNYRGVRSQRRSVCWVSDAAWRGARRHRSHLHGTVV